MNIIIQIKNPNKAQHDLIRLISVEEDIKKDKQDIEKSERMKNMFQTVEEIITNQEKEETNHE